MSQISEEQKTIVVIDDSRLQITIVSNQLEEEGFNVLRFGPKEFESDQNIVTALLEKLEDPEFVSSIDLVVTDAIMPWPTKNGHPEKQPGEFILRRCRELDVNAMMYSSDGGIVKRVRVQGFFGISKPSSQDNFIRAVKEMVD